MADGGRNPMRGVTSPLWRALLVPAVLTLVAGYVDAVGFLHLFGVFPANQSGNLILFGMSLTSPVPPPAWVSGVSIVGFVAGVAIGARLSRNAPAPHRAWVLLLVELVLLVPVAVLLAVRDPRESLLDGAALAVALAVAAVAMGVQTEVIRRVAGVAVSTTYESGTMAVMGEAAVGLSGSPDRRATERTLGVLGVIVVAYVLGATLGASALGDGRTGLVLPLLAVAACLPWALVRRGAPPA